MAEGQRSADEIRRDIERTRADMDETVEAIGQRLTPGQIVDGIWGRVKHTDAPGAVGDVVREHPLPAALIGAGLAWLAYDRISETDGERLRRKHGDIGPGTYERAEGRVGPYRGDELGTGEDEAGTADRARAVAESVRERAADVGSSITGAVSAAKDRLSDTASSAGDAADRARGRAGELAGQVRERAGEVAGRARQGFDRTLEDQPLAIGAVAFGLGLASGIAAPPSRWEDERVGRTADRVREEAKRTGQETAESVKRVAAETREAVRDVVEREGVKEELTERVKQVAAHARDAATQTAREAAEREGLAGERLRERARGVADRVRE